MRIERVRKASAEVAQIGKRLLRVIAGHERIADEKRSVILQFADLRLRLLHGGNGRRILRVEIVRVSDGEPGQRSGLGSSMGVRVGFDPGIGGGSAKFHELPRHRTQVAGGHEGPLHAVGARSGYFLTRRVVLSRCRFLAGRLRGLMGAGTGGRLFLVRAEVLSCASTPLPSRASTMARTTIWKRLWGFTGFSVARFLRRPDANKSFTKWIPACDICRTRPSVQ